MTTEKRVDPIGWEESLGEHAANPPTPRATGEYLFALGQEWKLSPDEARIKAQFENWVKGNAKRAIAEADMHDGPDEANLLRATFLAERGAGSYTWDGRCCRAARGDFPGIVQLVYLMLRRCQPDVTEQTARAICKDNWAGVLESVAAALGNWEAPTAPKSESGQARKNNNPTGGSQWKQVPAPSTPMTASPLKAREYTEEEVRRAEEILSSLSPVSQDR